MANRIAKAVSRQAAAAAPVILLALLATPAHALRVVDYNLLNYPGSTGPLRAPYYRTILEPLGADIIVTEEMSSASGSIEFLHEVLDVLEPGEWATVPFIDGNDTDASLFYKPSKLQYLGQWAFYPNPADLLRYVHVYRLRPVDYGAPAAELRIYAAHLKASQGYESQRLAECAGIRDSMNAMPEGTHALICGDMNFYTQAAEPGYARLLESEANNVGRVYDLLPAGAWHDGAAFAPYHTQSPCRSANCASGAATGGMDDRFDMILPTWNLGTGQGLAALPGTCVPVGNDGLHLNQAITDPPVIPEGAAYATALQLASDHLPVRLDLQVPSRITVDPSLAFDPVIVGAPAQSRTLAVGNPASPPADSLDCTFSAPDGFTAPLHVSVPAADTLQANITMECSVPGWKSGAMEISTDAPDDPVKTVSLSGTVLDHAVASLDSSTIILSRTVDFGDHDPGTFPAQMVRIFNLGYDALRARLLLQDAVFQGGGGRFSIAGGFSGGLVADSARVFPLLFDDANAPQDSTYTATLTFTSSDEPLPGALAQPDLVVSLRAHVNGTGGVGGPAAIRLTRLHAPTPNPLSGRMSVRLDLAQAGRVNLAVFDASGRMVARLAEGALDPGSHVFTWDGRNGGTPAGSGVYFLRCIAPGLRTQSVRLVIVR